MKKIYASIVILLFSMIAIAQNNNRTLAPHLSSAHLAKSQTPTLKHRAPIATHAVGDTVFIFDGNYIYDWNSTLPTTFNLNLEDIDSHTIATSYQPYFGVTGSFSFFYDTIKGSNLCYGHPDSIFFAAATSWFKTPAQANNWLELGPIHVPATGGTLKWRHNMPDPSYVDGYEVLVNTTGLAYTNFTNPAIFTAADNDALTAGDTVTTPHYLFYQRSADVSTYAGQDIYVAVHHNANDQDMLQITDIMLIDAGIASAVSENNSMISSLQNTPNPANDNTTINYSLKESVSVELSLFDVAGKKLSSLNQGMQSAGSHQLRLDVSTLSSGIYFYTISAGTYKMTNKMSVVK